MAKVCKITIKTKESEPSKEMSFEDYMNMLYEGGLENFISEGKINTGGLKGDNPFEQPAAGEKPKKKKKGRISQIVESFVGMGYGDLKQRAFGQRAEEQRGIKVSEYVSVDQKAMADAMAEAFSQIKSLYDNEGSSVFLELIDAQQSLTDKEKASKPGISYAYQVILGEASLYAYIKGDMSTAKKITEAMAVSGTIAGQTAAALSEQSTPAMLMNRIINEDISRQSFLNQVVSGEMTASQAIAELRKIAGLTQEEVGKVVAKVVPKVKPTANTVTVKAEFKRSRQASINAIKEIMSQTRRPGALSISDSALVQITPHIVNIAKSYVQEGAYSVKLIKNKVWNQVKDVVGGNRENIDKIIDDNAAVFEEEIKKNKEASVVRRLAKAFEGVINDVGVKNRALKILSDTILRSDPDYIIAKNNKEKVKAKDRLKIILNNKDQIKSLVLSASAIAKARVDSSSDMDSATKMAVKNEIDALVSDLLEMPIGDVEKRSAVASMNKEELEAEISRIASEYFSNPSGEIQTLAEILVDKLGIDPVYASALQKEIEPMVAQMVSDKIEANKARVNSLIEGFKDADTIRKTAIKAISKGEISPALFEDALIKSMGYNGVSLSDIAKLKNYYQRLSALNPGEELYKEINRYINDILSEYDESTAALVGRWFQEQFYINALSDLFKTAIMASGIGAIVSSIQHGAFTFAYNPARMSRAVKFASKMRSKGATMGWETVVAKWQKPESRFGETTLLERPTETAHGAVVRVTKKQYREMLDDITSGKGGRKAYFVLQALLKTASHSMASGARKRKYMPAISEISMVLMSAQDIIMGGALQDIYTYIEAEKYLDIVNSRSGVKMKKGSEAWNQQLREIIQIGADRIDALNKEVSKEASERVANGELLPKGWARRRLREKIHAAIPSEIIDEMAHQARKSLFLQMPETEVGSAIYNALTKKLTIRDKDSAAAASLRVIASFLVGFTRLSVIVSEYSYKATPVLPVVSGLTRGKVRYIQGRPTLQKMTNEEKITRVLKNAAITAAWAGLIASIFDYDDEDEQVRLNPDSWIKFYGSAEDNKQRAEIEADGGSVNSVTIFGKNIPLALLGFGAGSIGKILGEVSNDVRFGKEDKTTVGFDKVVGLVGSQITGSEMSPIKRGFQKIYPRYGDGKYAEAGEILLLDGIETALSPTLYENLKKDYEAWKGVQREKRKGVTDNIVGDIFFTDVFMDMNGGKVYDHFGQPVYVQPSNPVLKALLPENVWKNGTDHVQNSPYYNMTKEKWFPKPYTSWGAKDWVDVSIGTSVETFEVDDDFKQSLSLLIDKKTSEIIDRNRKLIDSKKEDQKIEDLKSYRSDAIEDIKSEYSFLMKTRISGQLKRDMPESKKKDIVYSTREKVVTELRKKYGIETN